MISRYLVSATLTLCLTIATAIFFHRISLERTVIQSRHVVQQQVLEHAFLQHTLVSTEEQELYCKGLFMGSLEILKEAVQDRYMGGSDDMYVPFVNTETNQRAYPLAEPSKNTTTDPKLHNLLIFMKPIHEASSRSSLILHLGIYLANGASLVYPEQEQESNSNYISRGCEWIKPFVGASNAFANCNPAGTNVTVRSSTFDSNFMEQAWFQECVLQQKSGNTNNSSFVWQIIQNNEKTSRHGLLCKPVYDRL